jgi:ubiquinone/menaquinone biosynthesis C-methylase UbiE
MKSTTYFDQSAKNWDADTTKLERALTVSETIRQQLPEAALARVFEYGCGTGLLGFALHAHVKQITLADNSPGMLSQLNEKISQAKAQNMRSVHLDLETDPPPDAAYDMACSLMTFHHVSNIQNLLDKLFALLSAPGYLCVADLDAEDGSFHGADFSGHNGFERDELTRLATQAGFKNIRFSTVFTMSKPESTGQQTFPLFLMVAEKC